VGDDSHVVIGQSFPGKKEVWDGALLWCDSQFFCRRSLRISLRTISQSHCKTSQ
jgi:hypothetical protein